MYFLIFRLAYLWLSSCIMIQACSSDYRIIFRSSYGINNSLSLGFASEASFIAVLLSNWVQNYWTPIFPKLNHELVVPRLPNNSDSVHKHSRDQNHPVTFFLFSTCLLGSCGRTIGVAKEQEGLYYLIDERGDDCSTIFSYFSIPATKCFDKGLSIEWFEQLLATCKLKMIDIHSPT